MGTEGRTITESSVEMNSNCPECGHFWLRDYYYPVLHCPACGMKKMQIDPYIYTLKCLGDIPKGLELLKGIDKNKNVPMVFWGNLNEPSGKAITMESGFFWEAFHIDTQGLYQHSSLCTPQAIREIEKFNAPVKAKNILEKTYEKTGHVSKYSQGQDKEWQNEYPDWHGVVLACQNPTDRSIRSVASPEQYYQFIEGACSFYGKDLFIKLHPWNNGEVRERIENTAKKYGSKCAKIDHKIIDKCRFVLVFNSTFSVDCFIREVPVAQFAPGYFWQFPSVKYTKWSYPKEIKTDMLFGQKLCDFLMWRYCFDYTMPVEKWIKMLSACLNSNELFPIPEEFSYASNRA